MPASIESGINDGTRLTIGTQGASRVTQYLSDATPFKKAFRGSYRLSVPLDDSGDATDDLSLAFINGASYYIAIRQLTVTIANRHNLAGTNILYWYFKRGSGGTLDTTGMTDVTTTIVKQTSTYSASGVSQIYSGISPASGYNGGTQTDKLLEIIVQSELNAIQNINLTGHGLLYRPIWLRPSEALLGYLNEPDLLYGHVIVINMEWQEFTTQL